MKFKKLKTPVFTTDLYYDLINGGRIDPRKMLLDQEEAEKVVTAIRTIRKFLDEAEKTGTLEIG